MGISTRLQAMIIIRSSELIPCGDPSGLGCASRWVSTRLGNLWTNNPQSSATRPLASLKFRAEGSRGSPHAGGPGRNCSLDSLGLSREDICRPRRRRHSSPRSPDCARRGRVGPDLGLPRVHAPMLGAAASCSSLVARRSLHVSPRGIFALHVQHMDSNFCPGTVIQVFRRPSWRRVR